MAVVEDYTKYRYGLRYPFTGTRVFTVDGYPNQSDALQAAGVPQAGDTFPQNTLLVTKGPVIDAVLAPDYYIVRCDYAVLTNDVVILDSNPLNQPPDIEWSVKEEYVAVDIDLDGNPIRNSAGDRFDPPSRRVTFYNFKYLRWESSFNIGFSQQYSNKTNSAAVTLNGYGITAAVEHMRCNAIVPVDRHPLTANIIRMSYDFDLFVDDSLGRYPFQHRFINVGRNGWYFNSTSSKTVIGPFVTNPGATSYPPQQIDHDVLLDLYGLPLTAGAGPLAENANIYVGDGTQNAPHPPVTFPGSADFSFLDSDKLTNVESGDLTGYALYYRATRSVDLNQLGL